VASITLCPPPADITIAIGMMENRDRFEYAVEKVTELGVRRIIPLASMHSSRRIPGRNRLIAKIRAACEQSGNPWLPLLEEPMSVEQIVAEMERETGSSLRPVVVVGAHNGERPAPLPEGPLMIVVGPEGGLHPDEELRLVTASARCWKVGDQRLRAETAAVALTVAALIERPASV
jgi:16S rRNA (uracil1498-N3)-methyltransferase